MVTAILVLVALRGLIALGRAQCPEAPDKWLAYGRLVLRKEMPWPRSVSWPVGFLSIICRE
jgi:hypothetical protein